MNKVQCCAAQWLGMSAFLLSTAFILAIILN
jgi:hypothetical protein